MALTTWATVAPWRKLNTSEPLSPPMRTTRSAARPVATPPVSGSVLRAEVGRVERGTSRIGRTNVPSVSIAVATLATDALRATLTVKTFVVALYAAEFVPSLPPARCVVPKSPELNALLPLVAWQ